MRAREWWGITFKGAGAMTLAWGATLGWFWAIDNLPCSLRAKWCARPPYSERTLSIAADIDAMGEGYEWTATPKKK